MKTGSILVFDIGSTLVKGGLFSSEGKLLESISAGVEMRGMYNSVFQEVDPVSWVDAVKKITADFNSLMKSFPPEAVAVSGNGPTLTVADKEGNVLIPAMTWLDRRAAEEAEYILKETGTGIDPSFYLPKILWLKNHRRSIYEKASFFFSPADYISYLFTGEAFMAFPGEGLETLIWTEELISRLDLEKEKFPPFINIGDLAGRTLRGTEDSFGIPSGIPVFTGGPDFAMSILGSGAVNPGNGCDRAGTSEGINVCCADPVGDTRLMCYRHVVSEYWNVTGIISTTGKAVEWFKKEFLPAKTFEEVYSLAAETSKGADKLIFLPYLAGERAPIWDRHARGTFIGLSLHHGIKEMGRAVLESTGYAIRDVLEVMGENGVATEELRVAGRAGEVDEWNQIKADITGKRVLVPRISLTELSGGLCTAMYGLGRFGSLKEASTELISIKKVFEPGRDRGLYDELFSIYRKGYRRLKDLYFELGSIE